MRVSINGNNGHSRARIALGEAEVRHLTAGFDAADTVKIKVEGSAATGLRLVAGNIGTTLKRAQGQGLLELPTSAIEAIHEPVSQVEVETLTERDDYGPVLRSAPLPEPFSPPEMRRTARRRIADFVVQNPRAAAEGLFKGRSVVKREERKPVPWEFDHRAVNELEARRVAVIKCGECGCTQEMGLRSMLPDAQIAKKFSQAGWHIRGAKAACSDCFRRKVSNVTKPPADMTGVIAAVTAHMTEAQMVEQLKGAMAQVNNIMDALGGGTIRLVVAKNRISARRMLPL